ncbi:VF530 family protein [Vaginella massiliensis]|uniref:VF530 family protein n=1 Tax=Vaginella massiliensis TaxID=1816680 RepID=UPI000838039F
MKRKTYFYKKKAVEEHSNDPLHGKKLVDIIEELVLYYGGFEGLGEQINIRCFTHDPSLNSSLKFLRRTPWAREKVENLYLTIIKKQKK